MAYRFVEHTADVAFEVDGSSFEELCSFAVAACGEAVYGDTKISSSSDRSFVVTGDSFEVLLYNLLEELLFLLDAECFVVSSVKSLKYEGGKLSVVVFGDDVKNYDFSNEVKAVTFSDLRVSRDGNAFKAVVVLDV